MMTFRNLLPTSRCAAAMPSNPSLAPARARMTNLSAGWGSVVPWPSAAGG